MNRRMAELLKNVDVESLASGGLSPPPIPPAFVTDGDSVLLRSCWKGAQHILPSDFSDRTGYESFINHVHLPWSNEDEVFSALNFVFELRRGLGGFDAERDFRVILAAGADDCTVRFHEIHPNEAWLADDLESYPEEAILTVDAFAGRR